MDSKQIFFKWIWLNCCISRSLILILSITTILITGKNVLIIESQIQKNMTKSNAIHQQKERKKTAIYLTWYNVLVLSVDKNVINKVWDIRNSIYIWDFVYFTPEFLVSHCFYSYEERVYEFSISWNIFMEQQFLWWWFLFNSKVNYQCW